MRENSQNSLIEVERFFLEEPDAEGKAWGVLHDFYHYLLTWMKDNRVSKAELARKLGKSRAYVTKMLRQTPNISIKKIVEITHKLGLDIKIIIEQVPESLAISKDECVIKIKPVAILNQDWVDPNCEPILPFQQPQNTGISINTGGGYGYA